MWPFKKKKPDPDHPYWRDAEGLIRCPGEYACPSDCGSSCPIHMNTEAAEYIMRGMHDRALSIFQKIVAMAPDFYDPWNNMGAIYGGWGNYQKANECYAKAHTIKPEKPAPVLGLALTSRDLGRYEECLRWCDVYDRIAGDHRADNARNMALAALRRRGM